jgi:hypothetical protein
MFIQMDKIQFFDEIKKEYYKLVLQKTEGLTILHLYEQLTNGDFENDKFTENDILKTLKVLHPSHKTDQKEFYNEKIRNLQRYFLWADEDKESYRLQEYAISFCKQVKEELNQNFNPTKIQESFYFLIEALDKKRIEGWLDTFEEYKHKIDRQLSALNRQVSESVSEFRLRISSDETYDVVILKDIIVRLEEIYKKAMELHSAFDGAEKIDDLLATLYEEQDQNTNDYLPALKSVRKYFTALQDNLLIISRKIERIRPRLNEYVRDLNKHPDHMRFRRFVKYVFENSRNEKGTIVLPDIIPLYPIRIYPQSIFKIIKEDFNAGNKRIARTTRAKLIVVDKEATAQAKTVYVQKLKSRKHIADYCAEADDILKRNSELDFSNFFYEILLRENGNINIPIKVASKCMKKYARSLKHHIQISNERIYSSHYPRISIWKTTISLKIN